MASDKTWVRKTDTGDYVIVHKDNAGATVMVWNIRYETREAAEANRKRYFEDE